MDPNLDPGSGIPPCEPQPLPLPPAGPVPVPLPDADTLDAHRLLVVCLFLSSFAVAALFLAVALAFTVAGEGARVLTPLAATTVAGAAGGFVSSLRRLYAFQEDFPKKGYERLFQRIDFYALAYSSIPALVGMMGALVLYLVFAAGLLQGDLFPAFECMEASCDAFGAFIRSWGPADGRSSAKAIVWGFIAGFSERLVPDILNRFGREGSASRARAAAPAGRTPPAR